ncbi:hypothetical protein FRC12_003970 [Ceratobasidium sp. 428]|nr:hypothetical protein FRC12_003970 [Ceratobasidium sp. 428]
MLDDAAPRGWSFHESFTTAYHEPASRHIPLHEDTFAGTQPSSLVSRDIFVARSASLHSSRPASVRTSSRPPRPPPASARLDRNLLPPLRPQPSSTPPQATWAATRRRPMYDPVRDSASSRPPDSPTHTRPAARSPRLHHFPEDEDRKPLPACQTCGEAHAGDCTSESHWRQYHDDDGDDEVGRLCSRLPRTFANNALPFFPCLYSLSRHTSGS